MMMALDGLKVVEVASFAAGPITSCVLAHYGAEVMKIEQPVVGDLQRTGLKKVGFLPPSEFDYFSEFSFHNKKCVAIDLKVEQGQKIAHRLVEKADIFVTNVQTNDLEKYHLDYETLSCLNPMLVYAQTTGYGEKGPDSDKRAYDLGIWARSGIAFRVAENSSPANCPAAFLDIITGTYTALGVMLALWARKSTGMGQKVENSIMGTALWSVAQEFQGVAHTGIDWTFHSRKTERYPFYNSYQTKDGKWIYLLTWPPEKYWHDFCEIADMPELEQDPRFDTPEHQSTNHAELIAIMDQAFASKTFTQWEKLLNDKNFIWEKAQTMKEFVNDPQIDANEYLMAFDHPINGLMKLVVPPLKMSATPGKIRTSAPGIGGNTKEVLLDLGYHEEDLAILKDRGVIDY